MAGKPYTLLSALFLLSFLSLPKVNSYAQSKATKSGVMEFWSKQYVGFSTEETMNPGRINERTILAKAAPDESYNGIGNPFVENPYDPGGVPKVNQAYVWGLAMAGDDLWFGTVANMLCLVIGRLMIASGEEEPFPIGSDNWVCEFGESDFARDYLFGLLPATLGDFRPPQIWKYDTQTGMLQEKSGLVSDALNLQTTAGLRSAGAHKNVVFFGGPNFSETITLFAFNAVSGEYIGSQTFDEYNNIRQWVVVDDVLYTGVARLDGTGCILKWTGSTSVPFRFEEVGNVDGDAAYLAGHEGRLFVSTWPSALAEVEGKDEPDFSNVTLAGLWMSPELRPGGLTASDADQWNKVWQVDEYEPDRATAVSYGGGALASFDGYLYFGTMNVPLASTVVHLICYAQTDSTELYFGSFRPISIFRGSNFFEAGGDIELLYGLDEMPVYVPDDENNPKTGGSWAIVPNNMGVAPMYGNAGFGNVFNNYTWTMAVFEDDLYVGTMDWSMLYEVFLDFYGDETTIAVHDSVLGSPVGREGGDLWRFLDSTTPAIQESGNGMDNYANYGIRTVISADRFYLGMANPMNLMTDTEDDKPEGGWELIELIPCDCDVDDVNLPQQFSLYQNYPNPFNSQTLISYNVKETRHVSLKVYDTRGREVAVLVDELQSAGSYKYPFSGSGLPAGIYMAQIRMGEYRDVKKMILVK